MRKNKGYQTQAPEKATISSAFAPPAQHLPSPRTARAPAAAGPSPHLRRRAVLAPRPARLLLPLPLFPAAEQSPPPASCRGEPRSAESDNSLLQPRSVRAQVETSLARGLGPWARQPRAGGKGRVRPRLRRGERRGVCQPGSCL